MCVCERERERGIEKDGGGVGQKRQSIISCMKIHNIIIMTRVGGRGGGGEEGGGCSMENAGLLKGVKLIF